MPLDLAARTALWFKAAFSLCWDCRCFLAVLTSQLLLLLFKVWNCNTAVLLQTYVYLGFLVNFQCFEIVTVSPSHSG